MTSLAALLSHVENASGPDRELDALICVAFADVPEPPGAFKMGVCAPQTQHHHDWRVDCVGVSGVIRSYTPKRYTASIDATIALAECVLPGWGIELLMSDRETWRARVWAWGSETNDEAGQWLSCYAATPSRALLAAIIKASMEAKE